MRFIVQSKVRRLLVSLSDTEFRLRRSFLQDLSAEIEHVVKASVKKTPEKKYLKLASVAYPAVEEQSLVCVTHVRQLIKGQAKSVKVSDAFFVDLNRYVAMLCAMSVQMMRKKSLVDLITESSEVYIEETKAKPVDRRSDMVRDLHDISPVRRRGYITVNYVVLVQSVTLKMSMRIFTAKRDRQLPRIVEMIVARAFDSIGLKDKITISITDIIRNKDNSNG